MDAAEFQGLVAESRTYRRYGARPLRRYLQHTVETLLAQRILRGDVLPGQTLVCDVQNGKLVITAK